MKLQIKLIKNELKKIFAKPSSWILLGLILFYATVSPIGMKALNDYSKKLNNNYVTYENQYREERKTELEQETDEVSKLASRILDEEIAMNKDLSHNNKLDANWKYTLYDEIVQQKEELFIQKLLGEGISKDKIKEAYTKIGMKEFDFGTISEMTAEDRTKQETDLAKKTSFLTTDNSLDYIQYLKESQEAEKKAIEKEKSDLQALPEIPAAEKAKALAEMDQTIKGIDKEISDYQYRLDNQIAYDDSWKDKTLNDIKTKEEIIGTKLLSEKEYIQKEMHRNQTYDAYKKEYTSAKDKAQTDLKLLQASLEKDQPIYEYNNSTRKNVMDQTGIVTGITLVLIIIASGIVATEYNKGTIRMLLASPVKRWKILLSKFLALFLVLVGMIILSDIITVIINGCIYGFSDLTIPYSYYSNGAMQEVNFLLWQLGKWFSLGIPSIFMIVLTVMLSVLFKNVGLALALPLLFKMVSPIVMIVGSELKLFFIKYTPIPYLNLSDLLFHKIADSGMSMYRPEMIGTLPQGIIILTGCTIICLMIAFSTFDNREVTN